MKIERDDLEAAVAALYEGGDGTNGIDSFGIPLNLWTAVLSTAVDGGYRYAVECFEYPAGLAVKTGGSGPPSREVSVYASGVGVGLLLGLHAARNALTSETKGGRSDV